MAYSFLAGAVATPVASGDLTLAYPADLVSGDVLLACITIRSTVGFTAPDATWTRALSNLGGDTDSTQGIASGEVWWKRYTGSGTSATFTRTAGDLGHGAILAVRGCRAAGASVDVVIDASTITTSAGTAVAWGNVTASAGGDPRCLIAFVALADNGTTGSLTATTPSGGTWNELEFGGTNTGADGGGSIYYHSVGLAAGATSSTLAATSTTNGTHVVATLALLPAIDPEDSLGVALGPERVVLGSVLTPPETLGLSIADAATIVSASTVSDGTALVLVDVATTVDLLAAGATFTIEVRQGATVIATRTVTHAGAFTSSAFALTAEEVASISDWTNLRAALIADGAQVQVSWLHLETPLSAGIVATLITAADLCAVALVEVTDYLSGVVSVSDVNATPLTETVFGEGTAAPSDTLPAGIAEAVTLLSRVAVAETLPITLSLETATLSAILTAPDSLAIALGDVSVLFVSTTVTDGAAVVLTDDLIINGSTTPPDTLAAGLGDSALIVVSVDAVESLAVVLADVAVYLDLFSLTAITASDAIAVVLTAEVAVLLASLTPRDTLPVAATEDESLDATLTSAETLPIVVSEDVIGAGTASPSETLAAGIGESALVTASLDAVEMFAVGLVEIGEPYDLLGALIEVLGQETLAVGLVEVAIVGIELVVLDTLPVGVTTERTLLLVTVTPTEALALGLDDAHLLIAGTATAADTLPAGLDEALILVATLAPTDTLAVGAADEIYLTYWYDAADTLPVGLSDVGTQELAEEEIAKAGAIGMLPWNRRQWRVAPFRATIRRKF